jgi:DNA (cytosine-5)-methyltransferase 1
MRSSLNFISLFCGCGGFDLGFIQAGYKCVSAFDIDPITIENHKANIGSEVIIRDLSTKHEEFSDFAGVDVVLAGPPCQGFSTIGKRRLDDPRNNLLLAAGKIAMYIQPKVFIIENVRGVVSGQHKQYWIKLQKILHSNGYQTQDLLVDTQQLGVAQTRKRMVLVASKMLNNWKPSKNRRTIITLRTAIENLNGAHNHNIRFLDPQSELDIIAKHIQPGQKLCNVRGGKFSVHTWDIPEVYGETTEDERKVLQSILFLRRRLRLRSEGDADPILASDITKELGTNSIKLLNSLIQKGYVRQIGNRFDLTHAFNGKFRRLHWDKPSLTVDTRFIDPRYFLHPQENRGFTVREAARIQGFPDSYIFTGTEKEQCQMVGNAVPPPLGKWLALNIKSLINDF